MTLAQDIRDHVALYVTRDLDLQEFEDWLVSKTWNVGQTGEQAAVDLTFAVERALSELTSGYGSEDDFRLFLVLLLQEHWARSFSILRQQNERPASGGLRVSSGARTELVGGPA